MARKVLLLMVVAMFMMMGVGCCPITKLNISIQLDKSFQEKFPGRVIKVDVVGVPVAEDDVWFNYPMTKYWANPNDMSGQRNTPLIKTLEFNANNLAPQVIASDDPKWSEWLKNASDKHAPNVYVLVQMPGQAAEDKAGPQDPRRLVLTTKSCALKGMFDPTPTMHVVITADRVRLAQQ